MCVSMFYERRTINPDPGIPTMQKRKNLSIA
jgi:hypothetical protein